jgi:uncharacterized membrane protein required for colicin V production
MIASDVTILSFLGLGFLIGSSRGFGGELCDIVKLVASLLGCIYLYNFVKSELNIDILQFGYVIFAIFFATYIFLGFFIGVILFPLKNLVRIILPGMLDNALGSITGMLKHFVLLLIFLYLCTHMNMKLPTWLNQSVIISKINSYGFNYEFFTNKLIDLKIIKRLDKNEDHKSILPQNNQIKEKIDDVIDVIDQYKSFKKFEKDEKLNNFDKLEDLVNELVDQ